MDSAPLNIVLTNDDGFDAPGIQTLYHALVDAGFNVHIVAPHVNQSAQGSSLGGTSALANPIDITEFSPGNFFVDGRPATATLTGLDDLFGGQPPDLVISGTNRGDNIGESENISGTVNAAVQGLFEGVPSIAVSAGSFNGSFDAGFANAASFMVNFLHELQGAQTSGGPLLPAGEGLSINVPGNPDLAGVSVTTITPESSASFPYAPTGPNTFAEGFVPNTSPSGSPTAEGSQFLTNHITISPIDGNWGATNDARDALAVRLGSAISPTAHHDPLNILLLDEDGFGSPGITATRQALLSAGYNVTVLAPSTDQSGVGSALFLSPITVTQFDASDFSANGTPASLVSLALDPQGLFNGARPDLVVVGADQGDAVGIENANHSATLGAAITALFNYGVPSIALTSASGGAADLTTSANFLTTLIENLQLTEGSSSTLLPEGIGLSVNVPIGASAQNYAFTDIDAGSDANLSVLGNDNFAHFVHGAPVAGTDPHSEGDAFAAGKITVSPIDGSFAVHDSGAYDFLASLIGTTFGDSNAAPAIAGDLMISVKEGGSVVVTTADLNEADPDSAGSALSYTVTATSHGQVLLDGMATAHFSQVQLAAGEVSFREDGSATSTASFSVSLADGSGLTAAATVNADVVQPPIITGTNGDDKLMGTSGDDIINALGGNDVIKAGAGNDLVNGGQGNDVASLGAGNDTFVWNPGDGSDTVNGQAGVDTLLFNGANAPEKIDISANGSRATLTRDVGNITMDLNGVEHIQVNALGGVDTITVNDLTKTDVDQVAIDLGSPAGSNHGDGASDTIVINGTKGDDVITIVNHNGVINVSGLGAGITISGFEATDRLVINGLGGDDVIDASGLAGMQLVANGGRGDDVLLGSPGNDTLHGDAGDDVLIGGGGQDVLDGGPGHNVVLNSATTASQTALLGQFMASSFVAAGNGHAATPVTDPASHQPPMLAHPHA